MKQPSLIVLLMLSLNGFGQNWAPFPLDSTSEWRVENSWLTGDECWVTENYNYYVSGQQIHQGNEYHVISYTGTSWSQPTYDPPNQQHCNVWPPEPISGTRGLLRSYNGKIYQADTDGEFVLYDFTLEVGDTVQGFGTEFVVDSIDQIDVNSNSCRRFWVNEIQQIASPIWIVENVGHKHGLFEAMYQFENSSYLCYRENGIPLVSNESGQACNILSVENRLSVRIFVSPNPSTGIFNLELQPPYSYQTFDLFGKLVGEGSGAGSSTIDLTLQPKGIYLLRVDSEGGSFIQKLVKQ